MSDRDTRCTTGVEPSVYNADFYVILRYVYIAF